jgi:hypothetical protein
MCTRHTNQITWIVVAVLALGALSAQFDWLGKMVESIGYLMVAVLAIWQHQIIEFIKPPKARLALHPYQNAISPSRDQREKCFHGYALNLNPEIPLHNAAVFIHEVQIDSNSAVNYVVPYRFDWAPSELKQTATVIHASYPAVFDIGTLFLEPDCSPPYFRLNRQSFQGGEMQDKALTQLSAKIALRADNLPLCIWYQLSVTITDEDALITLKEYGEHEFALDLTNQNKASCPCGEIRFRWKTNEVN